MRRVRLSFIICTFLLIPISAKAQMAAVECERILYEGATPAEANAALLRKAQILVDAGRYADATEALDRVRMFALSPEEAARLSYFKALSLYRQKDYAAALAAIEEGTLPEGKDAQDLETLVRAANGALKGNKSEFLASMLSVVPPLGQLYTQSWDKLWITPVTYGAIGLGVWQALQTNWLSAIASMVLLLEPTYVNSSFRMAASDAEAANERFRERELRKLEQVLQASFAVVE